MCFAGYRRLTPTAIRVASLWDIGAVSGCSRPFPVPEILLTRRPPWVSCAALRGIGLKGNFYGKTHSSRSEG